MNMMHPPPVEAPADPDLQERKPFFARVEFYLPLIFIGGLALAVLLYAEGLFRLGAIADPQGENNLAAILAAPEAPEVLLYASPTTARYLEAVGGRQDVLLAKWREFLGTNQRAFREVNDPAQLERAAPGVVIVPTALALSATELAALRAHQARGGAILASGAFGAQDARGEWNHWQAMQSLFGMRVKGEVAADSDARFLVTLGESPITHHLPAGSRIWLGRSAEAPLRLEGGRPAARLLDWARTPGEGGAGIAYGDVNGARWVLLGYSENTWDFNPTALQVIAATALDWLQRRPAALISAWPAGYQAAQIVEMDAEESLDNAAHLASMLELLKMRGTFYLLSSEAARHPEIVRRIAPGHELAYHGDVHVAFKGQPAAEQRARLTAMQRQLEEVLGKPIDAPGFRPPLESYDASTEAALQALGFRHHAVDGGSVEHRLPFFARANAAPVADDLVVLPRTQFDDFNLLHATGQDLDRISAMMKAELQGTIEQGALGLLSVHSHHFQEDGLIPRAVAPWLLTLADKRGKVWVATGGEVADWWRKREHLRANLSTYGKRYEIEISNHGPSAVEGAAVTVLHPDRGTIRLTPTKAWMPEATVQVVDPYRTRIVLGRLRPGNYAYHLTFE